jgi:hypothetical protein
LLFFCSAAETTAQCPWAKQTLLGQRDLLSIFVHYNTIVYIVPIHLTR